MHLHLVQFQLLSRQQFAPRYIEAYRAAFPGGYDYLRKQSLPAGKFLPAFGSLLSYDKLNADGAVGGNPPIVPYLIAGTESAPLPEERGWKDTVKAYPGQVTRLAVRFTQQDGSPFPFDATGTLMFSYNKENHLDGGPGYVWHCHMIDHEDNEMMRPFKLVK